MYQLCKIGDLCISLYASETLLALSGTRLRDHSMQG